MTLDSFLPKNSNSETKSSRMKVSAPILYCPLGKKKRKERKQREKELKKLKAINGDDSIATGDGPVTRDDDDELVSESSSSSSSEDTKD